MKRKEYKKPQSSSADVSDVVRQAMFGSDQGRNSLASLLVKEDGPVTGGSATPNELPSSGELSDEVLTALLKTHGPEKLHEMLVQKYGATDLRVLLPHLLPEYPRPKMSDSVGDFSFPTELD